jgi:hypothetical protein
MRPSRGGHATEGTISYLDVLRRGISIRPMTACGPKRKSWPSSGTSAAPITDMQQPYGMSVSCEQPTIRNERGRQPRRPHFSRRAGIAPSSVVWFGAGKAGAIRMWTFIVRVKASTRRSLRRIRPEGGISMSGSRFLARFLGAPSIAERVDAAIGAPWPNPAASNGWQLTTSNNV